MVDGSLGGACEDWADAHRKAAKRKPEGASMRASCRLRTPPLPGVPGLLKIASKKEGVLEKLSKPCVGAMGTEVRVNSEKLWTRVYANP